MKRKGKKIRNVLVGLLSLVLVICLTVAGTLAYLSATSNVASNVFTGSGGITVTLTEPSWDSATNGSDQYVPDRVFEKDPILTNTTAISNSNRSEFVAIKVSYQINDGARWNAITQAEFKNIGNVVSGAEPANYAASTWAFNTTDWVADAGNADSAYTQIFYYNTALAGATLDAATNKTNSIFDYVVIKDTLTPTLVTNFTTAKYVNGDVFTSPATVAVTGLPKFRIVLKGAAVTSGDYADLDAAKTTLVGLLPTDIEMVNAAE